MKDVALVYMSKYGHTKQYAEWARDALEISVFPITSFNAAQMLSYKLVIFASGVYSDKIQIMDFIKKNGSAINASRMMIAAVTWYTNESEEAKKKLIEANYPDNFKNVVPMVVLNSGIDKKAISIVEKGQLTAASMSINKHEERSSDDINALAIIKGYSDMTSKDNLKYLKEAIENFLNPKKPEIPAPKPAASTASGTRQMSAPVPPPKPSQTAPAPAKQEELKPEAAPVQARIPDPAPVPAPGSVPAPKPASDLQPAQETLSPYGSAELKGDPSPEEATLNSVEAAFKNLGRKPAQEEASAQSGSAPVVSSLDDALAALNTGNIFANAAPTRYSASVEPQKKPEPEKVVLPTADEIRPEQNNTLFVEAGQADTSVLPENYDDVRPAVDSALFVEAGEADTSVLPENYDDVRPAVDSTLFVEAAQADTSVLPENYDDVRPAVDSTLFVEAAQADTSVLPENYDDVRPAVDSTLFVEAGQADTSVLPEKYDDVRPAADNSFIPIEVPVIDGPDDYDYAVIDEDEDDAVLSVSDEIDEINKAIEAAQTAAEPAPIPAPVPVLHRPEPVKRPEPAAPKKNSYMEYFSKKNKAEAKAAEAAAEKPAEPIAEKPAPEAPKPAFERPKAVTSDSVSLFDPFADDSFDAPAASAPAPVPVPAPTPAPVNSALDDFDFDILGNESSTATGVSQRALDAVNALAKAKAAEEAEKAQAASAAAADAAEKTAAEKAASESYDVISNSLTAPVAETPAPQPVYRPTPVQPAPQPVHNAADDLAKLREEAEAVEKALMGLAPSPAPSAPSTPAAPAPSEYGISEFIADPGALDPVVEDDSDFVFSNDAAYDLDDAVVAEPTAAERDPRNDGMFDFRKLQQEIEDSIEVNRRIKEKDAQRRIRDRDRDRVITEDEQNAAPVKRLSEPLDPDLFFQRPGKDYYASDSMPEIRFDRKKRN
ncbi:MAG: hypothetical protein IJZ72_00125 [Oscillospiraceae bacterium]|nr:hypothetical protein [Oscillospiraceae bacterium]